MLESDVRKTVSEAVQTVMVARGLDTGAFRPDAKLADGLGLKSMDLAQIVLELEDAFDCDPFQKIPITSIRTVDDLAQAYLVTLGLADRDAPLDLLAEARARRAPRRR